MLSAARTVLGRYYPDAKFSLEALNEWPRDSKVFKQVASPSDWVVYRMVALIIIIASEWVVPWGKQKREKRKAESRP